MMLSPFKACAPAPELLEYPLFFPTPNYRGRPPPIQQTEEDIAQQEELKRRREAEAKLAPEPNVQKEKFSQINGGKPITTANAGDLSRSLGFAPSQADLKALHDKHGDNVTFEQFQAWQKEYCLPHKVEDSPDALLKVFQQYDFAGTGFMGRQQVETLLGNYADALTQSEISALMNSMGFTGDKIPYAEFVKKLLAE